jgi:histidinol-phosphate aminotransferase
MANVNLNQLIQPNILDLKAYHVETINCDIKLHANENPFPPSPELLQLLQSSLDNFELNRYPDPDCTELKQAIASKTGQSVDHLTIGNGSDELIQLILQVFCDDGDYVAFPDPTFGMYSIIARGMGLNPLPVPLNDHWDFDGETFLQSISNQNPKVIFISYPNNPTGNCFSEASIWKIIEGFQGIVVLDEAYYDFACKTFVNQLEEHNNLIVLRSLSKIGMAALRVGFAVAHPSIIAEINKVRLPYNSNTISQIISAQLLNNFSLAQKQIDIIIKERDRMASVMAKLNAITVFPSDSNFVLFRAESGGRNVFESLIQKGILIRDLGGHPRLKNCLRVTIGTQQENNLFLESLQSITK